MQKSTTLITGFFDLQKREKSSRRDKDYYFEKAEFLFKQDQNIIFFIDTEYYFDIWKRRKAHNLLDKTYIIPVACEDLEYVKLHLEATKLNFLKHPVHNFQPGKETPLYILITWSKFKLLNAAVRLNPFNSTHFAWIDFGLSHIAKTHDTILDLCLSQFEDKIKILSMKHLAKTELVDMNRYYDWIWGKMAAGFITGSKDNMLRLCDLFDKKVENVMKLGRAILEEQILPLIHAENPDLFKFYYGDYDYILFNYHKLQGNVNIILANVVWCRERNEFDMANEICEALLDSIFDAELIITPLQLLTVFHESFINGWNSKSAQVKCLSVVSKLSELCDKNSEFRQLYLMNYPKFKNTFNFAFKLVSKPLKGILEADSTLESLDELVKSCQVIVFSDEVEMIHNFPPSNPCYKKLTEISDFPNLNFVKS